MLGKGGWHQGQEANTIAIRPRGLLYVHLKHHRFVFFCFAKHRVCGPTHLSNWTNGNCLTRQLRKVPSTQIFYKCMYKCRGRTRFDFCRWQEWGTKSNYFISKQIIHKNICEKLFYFYSQLYGVFTLIGKYNGAMLSYCLSSSSRSWTPPRKKSKSTVNICKKLQSPYVCVIVRLGSHNKHSLSIYSCVLRNNNTFGFWKTTLYI